MSPNTTTAALPAETTPHVERVLQTAWDRYGGRLKWLARTMLDGYSRRAANEEDVVQEVLIGLWRRIVEGRLALGGAPDSLWPLLKRITRRKVIDRCRRERRSKRGGGRVYGETERAGDGNTKRRAMDEYAGRYRTPDRIAEEGEGMDRLLGRLDDPTSRRIVAWKLDGCSHQEIADRLGCARSTVIRKVDRIRAAWWIDAETAAV